MLDASSVDRIEVFKGPASLLYGRAQPGGAINFVSKRASFKRQGSLNLQHGRFNDRVQLAYNQPITKTFAARLAVTRQQRDGSNNRPDQITVINDVDHDERRVLNLNTIYRPFNSGRLNSTQLAARMAAARCHRGEAPFCDTPLLAAGRVHFRRWRRL